MSAKDRRVSVLFDRSDSWIEECAILREVLLDHDLIETFKWRSACYVYNDSNVAMIFRLKDSCGISFLRGALLADPEGLLEKPGPNSQSARYLKIRSVQQAHDLIPHINALICDAIKNHAAGNRVVFSARHDLSYPSELSAAFADDPTLAAAFNALTPGRQRSWLLHINGAKQTKTRVNRIAKGRDKIIAGKGQSEY